MTEVAKVNKAHVRPNLVFIRNSHNFSPRTTPAKRFFGAFRAFRFIDVLILFALNLLFRIAPAERDRTYWGHLRKMDQDGLENGFENGFEDEPVEGNNWYYSPSLALFLDYS